MDTIKTADITVWRMMTNYFAPETLCEIHHSKRRMTIVIFYLYITVFCLFARIRSRSLFSSVVFSVFLRARAHLGILLIAV
ncbi:hypothetical protein A628_00009 [Salmonella enterica subsp. enterica serovar Cubana str. 76814]|uniref:Uncharacterized protein n=5 Tax=Salmonella enterica I TaxID=59201 RepID=V7IYD0_SALET|nr:hypothetical protein A628_00009 [Salmonella enterica subsp. enterica serovar Cubana str. 76814]